MRWDHRWPGALGWVAVTSVGAAAILVTSVGPVARITWEAPLALFWIVTIAAGLCTVAAVWVMVVAHRDDRAEVGFLGAALLAVSVLPLVHGLTAPGVLYGPNSAVMASVYLALPLACLTALPLVVDGSAVARGLGRHWRWWSGASAALVVALAVGLLVWPNAVTVPRRGHLLTVVLTAGSLGTMLALSYRQLRLYWIGRRFATLVSAHAFAFLGLTSLVWVGDRPFSVGWWLVHAVDIAGVLLGCFALATGHRLRAEIGAVLEPLLRRDPLVAFEYGLSPVVHDLVAALDAKDPITRDHVVRVTELAIRVGERTVATTVGLRDLALGALLHDIGKLVVPDEILHKPARLTDAEFAVIQRHTIDGHALLAADRSLRSAAPIVRSHHERLDGRGYPDGMLADEIPLGARIVAVCDAFDAMANTRQYREGMGHDKAFAILREHAGSQWDPAIVECVIDLVERAPAAGAAALDGVGRTNVRRDADLCECLDALPPAVRHELEAAATPD